ncbi:MAG: DNA repair protein RecN [Gammaproteobacteria bacterium]|nr:DNA repair protein RecN [Gammaproteobacteria bacterium]
MFRHLTVKNFALVETLDIHFNEALTVITGESGAGKSILLDALGLVLGDRAAKSYIRPGCRSCEVTAEFDLEGSGTALEYLSENALIDEDQPARCLVRRVTNIDGRSRTFINGTPVNLSSLQTLCAPLVDVHDQHEHRTLLEPSVQLALLDDYGVNRAIRGKVATAFRTWRRVQAELDALTASADANRERHNLLTYQVEELQALNLEVGEVEGLQVELKRLANAQEIGTLVASALQEMDEEIRSRVARTHSALARIDDNHDELTTSRELIETMLAHADEAVVSLRGYLEGVVTDDARLAEIEQRLDAAHEVARKHRVAPTELINHLRALIAELGGHASDTSRIEAMRQSVQDAAAHYAEHAAKLSRARIKAAKPFAADMARTLGELGLKDAALTIEFSPRESEEGLETAEFLIATNPKYPAGTLKQIASGGELARISLAIQVVAAERSALPCLVLDEADVGVGGTTADVLGRLLRRLAEHTQVVCVTHAPQVAALGTSHLKVEKTSAQDTVITELDQQGRIEELSRMLGGQRITAKTREFAETLLSEGALA